MNRRRVGVIQYSKYRCRMSTSSPHNHSAFRYVKPHYVHDVCVLRCIALVCYGAWVTLRRGWWCASNSGWVTIRVRWRVGDRLLIWCVMRVRYMDMLWRVTVVRHGMKTVQLYT